MAKTKVLKNIYFDVDKKGYVSFRNRRDDDPKNIVLLVWDGNIKRPDCKMKGFVNSVFQNNITVIITRRDKRKDGSIAYQLGATVDAYAVLKHQGKIVEPEPYVA